MAISIGMKKIFEDENTVIYNFCNNIQIGSFINKRGDLEYEFKEAYGYCRLNKKTGAVQLDEEKSDPYFIKKRSTYLSVAVRLIKRWEKGEIFPEIDGICS